MWSFKYNDETQTLIIPLDGDAEVVNEKVPFPYNINNLKEL